MSLEDNKAVVRRYVQAVIDGDAEAIDKLQHPDVKWWVIGVGDMDRETYMQGVRTALLAASKRSVIITGMTAEGDRVAWEAKGEMVFPDRIYRNDYHQLYVIRDGLIAEGREYMDRSALTIVKL